MNLSKLSPLINRQFLVDADPDPTGSVLEQRCHLSPWQTVPWLHGSDLAQPENIQTIISNPHSAIPRSENGIDLIRAQPLPCGKASHANVMEVIDPPGRRNPDTPLAILEHSAHGTTR